MVRFVFIHKIHIIIYTMLTELFVSVIYGTVKIA